MGKGVTGGDWVGLVGAFRKHLYDLGSSSQTKSDNDSNGHINIKPGA